jgi:hypothetical protein
VAFDQDYGFEYTLLEPQDFWRRVPTKLRSVYHFFNAPVSQLHGDSYLSPIQIILDTAEPEDFVSFKLDIDTPEVYDWCCKDEGVVAPFSCGLVLVRDYGACGLYSIV